MSQMAGDEYKLINERVGLIGAIALLVGTAMGMSIFIVPTQMAAQAGPSIILAILVSVIPMIFGVLLLLQLGGAIPVAGGIYVYASRLIGPFWGLIGVALPSFAVCAYLIFAAYGFAGYLTGTFFDPGVLSWLFTSLGAGSDGAAVFSRIVVHTLIVWALLGTFLVINYVGIQIVVRVQIALVCLLIAGLLTFIVGGLFAFEPSNLTPMFPDGDGEPFEENYTPFLLAVILLFIPFQGFTMIIEIGEELENPIKNIPRVLALGMALVTVIATALVIVLVAAVPWQDTVDPETGEAVDAGLIADSVGGSFLPDGAIIVISIAALIAAATTVNTLLTSYSRTIMRAARDEVIPPHFATLHDEHDTPYMAILALTVPTLVITPFVIGLDNLGRLDDAGVLTAGSVLAPVAETEMLDWLVVLIVTGIFFTFIMGAIALWRLPTVFPQRYEFSFYKLPLPVLRVVAIGNAITCVAFTLLVATTAPSALLVVLSWIVLSAVIHQWRIRRYAEDGVDLEAQMALLHKHERLDSGDDNGND